MNTLVVGNVIKDIYLNLDDRIERFETDRHGIKWLDLSFNASEHHFFNRNSSLGGAAITFEVLHKLGLETTVAGSNLHFTDEGVISDSPANDYRYIMIENEQPCYFTPKNPQTTPFPTPSDSFDYIFIDRSASISQPTINKILAYLSISPKTKLIIYLRNPNDHHLLSLIPKANLIFTDYQSASAHNPFTKSSIETPPEKTIFLSDQAFTFQQITEHVTISRIDTLTHLSAYSIAAATILGCFILGKSVEDSLLLARINVENSKLDASLSLSALEELALNSTPSNLELIAKNLVLYPKGILAADESGGNIHKKFNRMEINDTYDNRRDYRNVFFTTPNLENYINGVILFDETAHQSADNGQNYVDYLTSKRIIPGIKVDQGLAPLDNHSLEKITKGLDNLAPRLNEYYQMGLRFAKWRAAFEIRLNSNGQILTPTKQAVDTNCQILAEYASLCQSANIVPIVEPEVVYDGYYSINQSASTTGYILDTLFAKLNEYHVNLAACILKVNMILPGKYFQDTSTPEEIGALTAKTLIEHVPHGLAGIVFLSGGQTPTQATQNLNAVIKHGPFPWPVTFSFARALQEPVLEAWHGNNDNIQKAHQAFLDRLIANTNALKQQ